MNSAWVCKAVCTVLFALELCAQTPHEADSALLHSSSGPMHVGFRCTDEDLQWAGLTCSDDEPCPIYLEFSHIAAVGQKIFATGNIHSSSNTLYSIFLASDDSGLSWREAVPRIRGGEFDHIQFFDFETGWVSGQMLQPLPGDAFLLLTTDGGKTWRRRPVLDEDSPGSLVAFWFDTRKTGSLVMDRGQSSGNRYQLYESTNGGESWMIRQMSSDPIKLRSAPPLDDGGGWRIRADSATKSFRIEKRDGESWKSIASFLLRLADCKPEPRTEAPPPPTTSSDAAPGVGPGATPGVATGVENIPEFRIGGPPATPSKKRKPK